VTAAYQKVLDTIFSKAGFGLKQASIQRSDGHIGHSVSVAGLQLFFTHIVKGTAPITVGLPPGVPCPIKLPSGFPLDPCAGVGFSLNAHYRGQVALGQVGVVSLAQPGTKTPPPPPVGGGGGGGGGTSNGGGNTGIGSTGTGSTSPGAGNLNTGPSTTTGSGPTVAPPTLANRANSGLDPLSGLGGRLWWFFPLMGLGVLALAGRFRFPARLPSQ
jgi:hypothetical protein